MKITTIICLFVIILSSVFLNSCNNNSDNPDSIQDNSPASATFKNVLTDAGFRWLGYLGQTASWGDFNNDGFLDIAIGNTDIDTRDVDFQSFFLYKNIGNNKYKEVTDTSGIVDRPVRSLTWADYDNDGDLDLAFGTIRGGAPPILYKNINGESFEDVSKESGFTRDDGFLFNAIWSDYNLDGHVDLFQINPKDIHFYKNNGDGTFTESASSVGIIKTNLTKAAALFDFNNDMYPDLFLANNRQDNFLINNGDGTFSDISAESKLGEDQIASTESVCTGDINNDGYIDIYAGTGRRRGIGNILYRNNGDGTFTDITESSKTNDIGDARTCSIVDYDSDGLLDIFTTNHLGANKLFRNLGDEKFENVAVHVGLDKPIIDIFSTSWADYNRDGFLDVFLNGHIGIGLMENSGNNNNNIIIELIGNGISTNRSAIGSRVNLQTTLGTQTREVLGGGGCCEQNMLPVHFGTGTETKADILVKWTDGSQCEFNGYSIEKNTRIKVNQTDCKLEVL